MILLVILAGISVFFIAQAIYWAVRSKSAASEAALLERLGQQEERSRSSLLRGDQSEAGFAQHIATMQLDAGEDPNPSAFYARCGISALITFALSLVMFGSPFMAILLSGVMVFLPYLLLTRKKAKRIARCEEQLPEALEIMTISLRAGHSLEQTIRLTASELEAPIGEEFRRVSEECELGLPLDDALLAMSERLKTARVIRTFVVSVLVLRQTGGNLIEVMENIVETMRMQSRYMRKLHAMTAEGRSSTYMLGGLPLVFVGLVSLLSPDYLSSLFDSNFGIVIFFIALLLYVAGIVWIVRLTSPKVN